MQKAVKWNTVTKVGVAPLRPLTLAMRNIFPHRCANHYDFSYFASRQHTSPFCTQNIATYFQQHFSTANASNSKISIEIELCKLLGGKMHRSGIISPFPS
jgi:hypothetical protein